MASLAVAHTRSAPTTPASGTSAPAPTSPGAGIPLALPPLAPASRPRPRTLAERPRLVPARQHPPAAPIARTTRYAAPAGDGADDGADDGVREHGWFGASDPRLSEIPAIRVARGTPAEAELDSLALYLREIVRIPLLSTAEERALAARIGAAPTPAARAAARQELVERNLRLVVAVAKTFHAQLDLTLGDLIQEGSIGLMHAAEKFNPALGYKFSTYATWWIRQAIGRALLNETGAIRLPVHLHEKVRRYHRLIQAEPAWEHVDLPRLAARMGTTEAEATWLRLLPLRTLSLEQQLGGPADDEGEEPRSLAALLPDVLTEPVEVQALARCEQAEVRQLLTETLTPRERRVLCLRYRLLDGRLDDREDASPTPVVRPGTYGAGPRALDEVARLLGASHRTRQTLSRERIRQIEASAFRKLRRACAKRAWFADRAVRAGAAVGADGGG